MAAKEPWFSISSAQNVGSNRVIALPWVNLAIYAENKNNTWIFFSK